tara:strand:+ start:57 stop:1562 length:1506 start_codon:yes stop_codon:yes gene_type:complete
MSEVISVSTWNGMPVKSFTDMKTGRMKLFVDGPIIDSSQLIATSTPSNGSATWTLNDPDQFRQVYNNFQKKNNKPELSEKDFKKTWNTTGTKAFNNIRGTQLNNSNNYFNKGIAPNEEEQLQKQHFANSIPGVTDPVTGVTVNSDGTKPSEDTTGEQEPDDGAGGAGDGAGGGNGDGENNPPLQTVIGEDERRLADEERGGPRGSGRDDRTGRPNPGKTLRYPLDEPGGPFEYDYISITAHDYEPSGLDVIGKDAAYRNAFRNLGPAYERVIFPMQPQLSETNAVNWSDDQLNPVQGILGQAAVKAIEGVSNLDFKQIQGAFSDLGSKVNEALNETGVKAAVAAYFAGQAVGANLQGRLNGQVINPNLELLFNGPNLRTFNFNFRLTPRFKEESEVIREIIFAFKRNMSVQRTSANLFLRSPRLFQLEYIYKEGGQHPYLNKFKPCAMTNFQVNYTPDGSYATFDETGSLTAYDLTMSFSEIIPIFTDDNKYTENPTDMGF